MFILLEKSFIIRIALQKTFQQTNVLRACENMEKKTERCFNYFVGIKILSNNQNTGIFTNESRRLQFY